MAAERAPAAWVYSQWDDTQLGTGLSGDDVLAGIADDLLYHGDLDAALRRLVQQGFSTPSGERVGGLREVLDKIAARRAELLERSGLSRLYEEYERRLDDVLATERDALEHDAQTPGGDPGTVRRAAERGTALDLLPPDLAGRIEALGSYDFSSGAARAGLEEIMADLRRDLAQLQLDRAAGALAASGPAERAHLRAAIDALNTMIEQRAAGVSLDPSFDAFMATFGDVFPGGARDLDELMEQLARRMAATSALVASMSPEQRNQLAELSDQMLSDMDLAWQLDRLGGNLRAVLPRLGWDAGVATSGSGPRGLAEASALFVEIGELDALARMLRSVTQPGELGEVDLERVGEQLGPDAAASLQTLAELTRRLEEQGLVSRREGRLTMTPRGRRRIGSRALDELFTQLRRDRVGEHPIGASGIGHDRDMTTKAYEHGDPLRLDLEQTLRNALLRLASSSTGGDRRVVLPLSLVPDDFEIELTEHLSTASTVLAIDLSLSMPMRDNFLAAKKVALALQSLIATRYPRDFLGLVGFSATAREIRADELPEVAWDFAYGTNLQHALALARRMLATRPGAKQVIVITDGEPTAHVLEDGDVFFDYPPSPETLAATFGEVARCTRAGITVNTFVLDATGDLRSFVEKMTRLNRGRAFFTTPDDLGGYVLVDFVAHRSPRSSRIRPGT